MNKKFCHICKNKFDIEFNDDENYQNVWGHCHCVGKHRCATYNIFSLRYKTRQEIPAVLHNWLNFDYHFILWELTEEFEGQFERLGENTEKHLTFSVPIKKKKNCETATYKIKFIDRVRFVVSSLSSVTDNLAEGLHKGKCKDSNSTMVRWYSNVQIAIKVMKKGLMKI